MEGDRVRVLTARAVLVTLAAALLALGLGLVLLRIRHQHVAAGTRLTPLGALPGELLALRPQGWLSLGVIVLLLTPLARLAGMAVELWGQGQRRSAGAAVLVALLLVGALVQHVVLAG